MASKINIYVLTWKDDSSLYFPNGLQRMISCNHVNEGNYGVNIRGESFPIPATTVPPLVAGGADFQKQTVLVKAGNVYGPTAPFATGDPNYKLCVKVKDMSTNITYFLDAVDYATKIIGCNFVPYASACGIATNISAGTPATTSATITWTDAPGGAAIEYINNTSGTTPVIDGTLLPYGTQTVAITGLTAATTYHFWIRTLCTGGVKSAWTSLTYITHA